MFVKHAQKLLCRLVQMSLYQSPYAYFGIRFFYEGDKLDLYLSKAIQLAKMVKGQTGVNPPVGAVVVKNGRIIGLGAHLKQGEKHAEVQAIDMAGDEAQGATIYVSLQPCMHYGSTPPCVNKIIDHGLDKVVYAVKDTTLPSKSDEILTQAGIQVYQQFDHEAYCLYEDFFKAKAEKIPEITVKVSTSIDGKQATDYGQSQWITNKTVKQDVYRLRHSHDAVLTGNKTVLADNPQYTTRVKDGKHPIRVILSRSGDVDFSLDMFHDQLSDIWIYTEDATLTTTLPNVFINYMSNCKIPDILQDLYKKGVGRLLVEAGPKVTSLFLQQQLVNQLIIYFAPKLIGGSGTNQFFQTQEVIDLQDTFEFEIVNSTLLDQNIKLELRKK